MGGVLVDQPARHAEQHGIEGCDVDPDHDADDDDDTGRLPELPPVRPLDLAELGSALSHELSQTGAGRPLADFDGEIIEVNAEAGRLKVAVSIFERSVPVDLTFDQVKRLD